MAHCVLANGFPFHVMSPLQIQRFGRGAQCLAKVCQHGRLAFLVDVFSEGRKFESLWPFGVAATSACSRVSKSLRVCLGVRWLLHTTKQPLGNLANVWNAKSQRQ